MQSSHLAQVNIGRLLAPLDAPEIAGFVGELDSINQLAEGSPGFIWRLQSDEGNATDLTYNEDPLTIVNLSVWDSIGSLKAFTYDSRHLQVFRNRSQWFHKMELPHYCLWWVPAGHRPDIAEARNRLENYQRYGPTPEAFWFSQWYPAPAHELAPV